MTQIFLRANLRLLPAIQQLPECRDPLPYCLKHCLSVDYIGPSENQGEQEEEDGLFLVTGYIEVNYRG